MDLKVDRRRAIFSETKIQLVTMLSLSTLLIKANAYLKSTMTIQVKTVDCNDIATDQ